MFKKALLYIVLLMISLCLISMMGCGGDSRSPGEEEAVKKTEAPKTVSKLEQVKKAGKLVVGTTDDYPPYEFRLLGDEKASIVGLDIDIAQEIANRLGVKLEIKSYKFNELLDALNSDAVDMVVAAMSPTNKRREIVNFSTVYYKSSQAILILAKNSDSINNPDDLKGKKVGTQVATVQMELGQKHLTESTLVEKYEILELVNALKSGNVDAVLMEKPVADSFTKENKDLIAKACHLNLGKSQLGAAIAVKKGTDDFLKEINATLEQLKANKKIDEFVEKSTILTADVVR